MDDLNTAYEGKAQPMPGGDEKPLVAIDMSFCMSAQKKRATKIINAIAENSELGRDLLEQARKDGYKLIMIGAQGWAGQVDADHKYLYLNACENDDYLVKTMAHECRHIQQFARGAEYDCSVYNIRDALRFSRCKEADAEATAAAVCHEIRAKTGYDAPLKEFAKEHPEIVGGFEKAVKDPSSPVVTNEMMQGAFDGWYKEDAMVQTYETGYIVKGALNHCWDREADQSAYFRKKTTSAQILKTVCANKDGSCYWENELDTLNRPERLLISEATVSRVDEVLGGLEKVTGKPLDRSYRDMPRRETFRAEPAKEKGPSAAVLKTIAERRAR